MRVIAGTAKGHKLRCIQGINTRPTSDRVKESIFNIIMNYIAESSVLDLFSGTGNLGIEALSRGAKECIMIDNNPQCIKVILQNLEHTKLNEKAKVICSNAVSSIRNFKDKFDIIFIDAPYNKGHIEPVLRELFSNKILNANGIIILERNREDIISDSIGFNLFREESYGNTVVSFLNYKEMVT